MTVLGQISQLTAYMDNYGAFKEYLCKYGMDEALREHKLTLRHVHTITPTVRSLFV
jgi:hypothetical protein